jgi:hypothetical protein
MSTRGAQGVSVKTLVECGNRCVRHHELTDSGKQLRNIHLDLLTTDLCYCPVPLQVPRIGSKGDRARGRYLVVYAFVVHVLLITPLVLLQDGTSTNDAILTGI